MISSNISMWWGVPTQVQLSLTHSQKFGFDVYTPYTIASFIINNRRSCRLVFPNFNIESPKLQKLSRKEMFSSRNSHMTQLEPSIRKLLFFQNPILFMELLKVSVIDSLSYQLLSFLMWEHVVSISRSGKMPNSFMEKPLP